MQQTRNNLIKCELIEVPEKLEEILASFLILAKEFETASTPGFLKTKNVEPGAVVRKPINPNLGLKLNRGFHFSC